MGYEINKLSNVDFQSGKGNFYNWALDGLGDKFKDLSKFTGKEICMILSLIYRLCDEKENQISLSDKEVDFIRIILGEFK